MQTQPRTGPPLSTVCRRTLVAAMAAGVVVMTVAGPVRAADDPDDGRRTLDRLPQNLGRTAIGIFSTESLAPALVGGAATGLGALLDDEAHAALADESNGLAKAVSLVGGPGPLSAATLVFFIAGRSADEDRFRAVTYDLAVADAVVLTYTGILKAIVGRERPNGANDNSFPSGHASCSFALATVLSVHYGASAGVPAYAAAGVIAWSRLRLDAHWLSDLLAGGTLGYIVGRTAVRENARPLAADSVESAASSTLAACRAKSLRLSPLAGPGQIGLLLTAGF